ncbi:MAG: flagellar hook-associated protein FlgL [Pseudomonadota bacterium]
MRISTPTMNQRGIDGMLDNQTELSHVQKQMSSGKRVLTPADDPVAATQMLNLRKSLELTEQYQKNADYARNRMNIEEQTLESSGNVLQRVRELVVQANNDSLDNFDREAIAKEVDERLKELVGLANAKDGAGEYLFSGSRSRTTPFSYTEEAGFQYHGDNKTRKLQIGPDYEVQQTTSGERLFMDVAEGNRTFSTDYNPENAGSGVISEGRVASQTDLTRHAYTLDVVEAPNDDADSPLQIRVFNEDRGEYVIGSEEPPEGQPYKPGMDISFDGIALSLEGKPQPGDEFTIEPSRSQSVFDTIGGIVESLKANWDNPEKRAKAQMEMDNALIEVTNAMDNILNARAGIGARINSVDSQSYVNDAYSLQMEETLSGIEDLDYASATGELNMKMVGLQAAQQVYSKLKDMSLFNYVR